MLQNSKKSIDFSYLKPPQEAYKLKHDDFYIKHGEGIQHVRKIFYNQKYDDFEEEKIKELEQAIQQEHITLPNDWTRELTMKYVYSGGFNITRCMERLKKHLEWRVDSTFQTLSAEAEDYLNKGYVYSFGRDPQYRPVIYIQLFQVTKLKLDIQALLCAATNLYKVVSKYMLLPGLIENWNVVLDFNGTGLFDTSFSTISKINDVLSINFTSTLHRIDLEASEKYISDFIQEIIHPETAGKIQFFKKSEFHEIHKHIDPSQIEEKYGGTHPNLTVYWPVVNTLAHQLQPETPGQSLRIKSDKNISGREEFYSILNESVEFFDQKYLPLTSNYLDQQQGGPQHHSNDEKEEYVTLNNNADYHQDPPKAACCTCQIF